MATHDQVLAVPPEDERAHALWLQHAVGHILFEDVRTYAIERIDPAADPSVQAVARKAIDDALYGLMQVLDGVSGALANGSERVELRVVARHVRSGEPNVEDALLELDLAHSDGMCMGYHRWRDGDFGKHPIIMPASGATH